MLKWIKKILDFGTDASYITPPERHSVRLVNGICFFSVVAKLLENIFTFGMADTTLILHSLITTFILLTILLLNYKRKVRTAKNIFTGLLFAILLSIPFTIPHSLNADGLYLVFLVIIFAIYNNIRVIVGLTVVVVAILLFWHIGAHLNLFQPTNTFQGNQLLYLEIIYTVMMVVLLLIALLTFRKSATDYQNELSHNLHEKDMLLREVHHRVKNNLQMIVSMLGLQQDGAHSKEALDVINDVKARVVAMSIIHNKLYANKDLQQVELGGYITELANLLYDMNKGKAIALEKKIEVENYRTGLEFSIPLGLIITEVVSNSIKHAFAPGQPVMVEILGKRNGDYFVISIRDNGSGLDTSTIQSEGLGFMLINILCKQIQAEMTRTNDNGLVTTISFKA
ncbi:MAG: sensor histidine kinase [Cytophagaceae bacterium]